MNKIVSNNILKKRYSKDEKDDDQEKEKRLTREKGGKAKAETIQEESYFHKEEVEQLKELKKKIKYKPPEADSNK